jgi:hypothetical protein
VASLAALAAIAAYGLGIPPFSDDSGSDKTAQNSQTGDDATNQDPAGLEDQDADAPRAFEPEPAHTIPVTAWEYPPVAVHDKTAWVTDEEGVEVLGLLTGESLTRIEPENPPLYEIGDSGGPERELEPPEVVELDGETALIATIPVQLSSGEQGIEVIAVRAEDREVMWRLPVDLEDPPDGWLGASVWNGTHDGIAPVQWTVDGNLQGTVAVDLEERQELWERTDFSVVDGYGGSLVGFAYDPTTELWYLKGVGLADGLHLWTTELSGDWSTLPTGGPWTGVESSSFGPGMRLLDIATGEVAFPGEISVSSEMTCRRGEGGDIILCASDQDGVGAVALNAETRELLWQRSSWQGEITAAFGDLVYVTRADGPAVVDARTGDVVTTDAGIAPDMVSPYAGLVITDTGVEVHLARSTE